MESKLKVDPTEDAGMEPASPTSAADSNMTKHSGEMPTILEEEPTIIVPLKDPTAMDDTVKEDPACVPVKEEPLPSMPLTEDCDKHLHLKCCLWVFLGGIIHGLCHRCAS